MTLATIQSLLGPNAQQAPHAEGAPSLSLTR